MRPSSHPASMDPGVARHRLMAPPAARLYPADRLSPTSSSRTCASPLARVEGYRAGSDAAEQRFPHLLGI
jgi:hypothetical protein